MSYAICSSCRRSGSPDCGGLWCAGGIISVSRAARVPGEEVSPDALLSGSVCMSPVVDQGCTYDFSSCFIPKFKIMHYLNRNIKMYTVVLLVLCFLKILTKLCCR